MRSLFKEVEDSPLLKPIEEEINLYGDSNLNQEAIENYREKYGRDPTPEELDRYVFSTEEVQNFIRKRNACLV